MIEKEMRAVVYLGPGKLEIQQVPVPKVKEDEILVKVRAAPTCGTDVKIFRRGHQKFPAPFIFGHEFGGDIVEVGSEVKDFKPGMRVTANVNAECGVCFYCKHGQGNLCENLYYNFGSFAEYHIVPGSIVRLNTFEIPDHISYAGAALLEPLVCVMHGHRVINIQEGESVAIIGAGGPISLLFLQLALKSGASQVIAIGHSDFRLSVAEQLGATTIINSNQDDSLEVIKEQTKGKGADIVIECAGAKSAWEQAVEYTRKGGRVLWFGGLSPGTIVELDAAQVHYGEISIHGVHGGTAQDARQAFELIASGEIDTKPLLSEEMPLEQIESAFQKMIDGKVIKVVIDPQLSSAVDKTQ